MEAEQGISELIDAMSRADRRAVKSQLVRLMKHIIKWKKQPQKRSISWIRTILNARMEIEDIQEETPSITGETIRGLWPRAFQLAIDEAMEEMEVDNLKVEELTWEEVFNNHYFLEKE